MQISAVLNPANARTRAIAYPWPALGVLLFGVVMLYSIGFSSSVRAHNAAHDTRHANGFPCH